MVWSGVEWNGGELSGVKRGGLHNDDIMFSEARSSYAKHTPGIGTLSFSLPNPPYSQHCTQQRCRKKYIWDCPLVHLQVAGSFRICRIGCCRGQVPDCENIGLGYRCSTPEGVCFPHPRAVCAYYENKCVLRTSSTRFQRVGGITKDYVRKGVPLCAAGYKTT